MDFTFEGRGARTQETLSLRSEAVGSAAETRGDSPGGQSRAGQGGLRLRGGLGVRKLGRCPRSEKDKQQILSDLTTPPGGWRVKPAILGLMRESGEKLEVF